MEKTGEKWDSEVQGQPTFSSKEITRTRFRVLVVFLIVCLLATSGLFAGSGAKRWAGRGAAGGAILGLLVGGDLGGAAAGAASVEADQAILKIRETRSAEEISCER